MTSRPFASSADRNGGAIVHLVGLEFPAAAAILEIGSGTGQHAIRIGRDLPHLSWQPSDIEENLAGIRAWVDHAGLPNVCRPLEVDVLHAPRPGAAYDGVFSANTAHIMHEDAVRAMFDLSGNVLRAGGRLVLYGPMRRNGGYNTESNAAFDRSLQQRDPGMGIRDLEWLDELAAGQGMHRVRLYSMPANNHVAVWARTGGSR